MPQFWYHSPPSLVARLLQPLSWLYAGAARLHGWWRGRSPYFASVPVISVGNLVVGGAGKTPITACLAQHYAAQGHQVAIVSRGYGGSCPYPLRVLPHHPASWVGDEPLFLSQTLGHLSVQVWVGRHRPSAVQRAEASGATLILLDDGFQRHDVHRHVNLLVVDGPTQFGNGLCLPAGPLREPLAARQRATLAIILNEPAQQAGMYYGLPAVRLGTQSLTQQLPTGPVVAFTGLARPNKFFQALQQAGVRVVATHSFPDHHPYTAHNLNQLRHQAIRHQAALVTTAKDAVKLPEGFAHVVPLQVVGNMAQLAAEIDKHLTQSLA